MDTHFAIDNGFALQNLQNPLRLTLFDGSAASQGLIHQYTTLDIEFPCGTRHSVRFLLTSGSPTSTAVSYNLVRIAKGDEWKMASRERACWAGTRIVE